MAKEIGLSTESLKVTLVTGGAGGAELVCAGTLKDQSELVSVIQIDTDYTADNPIDDLTATSSIPADGKVSVVGDTSSTSLLVIWLNHDKKV